LSHRDEIVRLLRGLPQATVARDDEIVRLMDQETLSGVGIGYVDAQLLAATKLTPDATLWTRNKRLSAVTAHLG
jgi:hypothetical protein